jgi:hypothetical protein
MSIENLVKLSIAHGTAANRNLPSSIYDSPPALALREAGAGISSLHGITRNPWGLACNTGGSSSGAGASLAGIGFASVGTDIADDEVAPEVILP